MGSEQELPDRTRTVVIGAGMVGCSAAYHLTELGRTDVTVVEKGPLVETGGSSIHAPGGLFQTSPSKTLTEMASYTVDLYRELGGFDPVGGIELATTDERWEFLKRRLDHSKSWGIEGADLLPPAEVADRSPLVDPDAIHGGYYVPTDGQLYPFELMEAFIDRAEERGAAFHGETAVVDIERDGGAVSAVVTDRGRIETDEVLVAANLWSPVLGGMVGVDIPLIPCEHQYAVTEPLAALDGADGISHPWLRHQDASMYFRQHGDAYGVGSYNHEPMLLPPEEIDDHETAMRGSPIYQYAGSHTGSREEIPMPSLREFTDEDFETAWAEARRILPALEGAGIREGINGLFAFSPDGMPIVGEAGAVEGFWVSTAVWLTHAGGVGRATAELMTGRDPSFDLTGCSIDRVQPHWGSSAFVRDRAYDQYDEVYDIVHPRAPAESHRGLRRSAFHNRQADLDATFFESAGWERPQWYGANESLLGTYGDRVPDRSGWEAEYYSRIQGAEHLAVRDGVGLFDLSNFTHVEVAGPGAAEFLQRLFTADVDVEPGTVTYTTMLNDHAGVLGDMTVCRRDGDRYLVVAGAGRAGTQQLAWIRDRAPADGSVRVTNAVSQYCCLGVWGPDARGLLAPVAEADLSAGAFPYYSARETHVGSVPVLALRVSYVGELGWELHAPAEYGGKLWDLLREAGREHDAVPMGDGALNSMRLEKGYRLWGADVTPEYTPDEAGLGFAVDTGTDFIGKEALLAARDTGPGRSLACLTVDAGDRVPMPGSPVLETPGGDGVGYCTSVDYGYSVGSVVAYGYVPAEYAEPGTELYVQYEAASHPATVREEPLFDPDGERLRG